MEAWLSSADLVRQVASSLYQSDVCSLWRTCKTAREHLRVDGLLWVPNIFLLNSGDTARCLAEVHPDSVQFMRIALSKCRDAAILLPFAPHLKGLGIELSSAYLLEVLTEQLHGHLGKLDRLWVEFIGHSLALDGSIASPTSIDDNIALLGNDCREVYVACIGGSMPLRMTAKIGTKVTRLTLAGKFGARTLERLSCLPRNQLICLDLARCHLPQRQPLAAFAEIIESHSESLSYMSFKCSPVPNVSEILGVSGRHPRLVCFMKLVRDHEEVVSITVSDLSPRATFSASSGSRAKCFDRYDHLQLLGWDAFGVFAATFGNLKFRTVEDMWAALSSESRHIVDLMASRINGQYNEYRKLVPAAGTGQPGFELSMSSDSESDITELSSSWRSASDRLDSSSSEESDESTSSDGE
ncbi:hypothetical protein FOL47_010493 [Perkinsus chesapeaki]|uniref:Uncharacterized protein n=1 Tax=Perkinsus chesapeaki TaxID=330153 RepID=A0A7J6L1L1_PERCH|nr:hypothetical protein FOL47_010493 [Perkinsus chesapeaki]